MRHKNLKKQQTIESLSDSNVIIKILIIDRNISESDRLAGAISRLRSQLDIAIDPVTCSIDEAEELILNLNRNVIFIDILTASENVEDSYRFIKETREKYNGIVFVLYSDISKLITEVGTIDWWVKRLQNYYKLDKAYNEKAFNSSLFGVLEKVELDLQIYGVRKVLENTCVGDESALTKAQIDKISGLFEEIIAKLKILKTYE